MINENGVTLNKDEIDCLLCGLNTDNDGSVDYDKFLACLRGQLNDVRRDHVKNAFCKFDKTGCGRVCTSDLRVAFNCSAHPRVIAGVMTEDEAFLEFLTNFGDKNNDGCITMQEWGDYYSAVSASIASDEHFCQLLDQAWC